MTRIRLNRWLLTLTASVVVLAVAAGALIAAGGLSLAETFTVALLPVIVAAIAADVLGRELDTCRWCRRRNPGWRKS